MRVDIRKKGRHSLFLLTPPIKIGLDKSKNIIAQIGKFQSGK